MVIAWEPGVKKSRPLANTRSPSARFGVIGAANAGRAASRHRASAHPSRPLRDEIIQLPNVIEATSALGISQIARRVQGAVDRAGTKEFCLGAAFCHRESHLNGDLESA